MTWQELIEASLRRLGVLGEGEGGSQAQIVDGLEALNLMIDGWATQKLSMYVIGRTTWTIAASTTSYTVGTGGTINVARPTEIDHVGIIDTADTPDSEELIGALTEEAYAGLSQKALTDSGPPTSYYYDHSWTAGLGRIYLFPITTAATYQGALYARTQVAEVTDVTTTISLPPGYRRAIVTNLAKELAPEYERELPQEMLDAARESKEDIERVNVRLADQRIDSAWLGQGMGRYNIKTDR